MSTKYFIQIIFIERDKEDGFLLIRSRDIAPSQKSDGDDLRFKQEIFSADPLSFYGLTYDLLTIDFLADGRNEFTTGIWIPLPLLYQLPTILSYCEERGFILTEELHEIMQLITLFQQNVEEKKFHPSKMGLWDIEKGNVVQSNISTTPLAILQLSEHPSTAPILIKDRDIIIKKLSLFFQHWLQYHLLKGAKYNQIIKPYFHLLDQDKNPEIDRWIHALKHDDRTYELSQHLYPYCLKCWNGKTEDPFQLVFLLTEPEKEWDNWTFEILLKEWATGHIKTVEFIFKGEHPFLKNPISYVKEHMLLIKNIFPINKLKESVYKGNLTLEEVSDFFLSHSKQLEKIGITILVPQRLREISAIPKIQGTLMEHPNESKISWNHTTISWTFLVNGIEVDEIMFKQWVEEKRQMIYINNHWMMWNLALAEKLFNEYENNEMGNPISFFDAWKKAFLAAEMNQDHFQSTSAEYQEHASTIEWTLSPGWYASMNNQITRKLPPHWEEMLRPYQQEGVNWLLNMRGLPLGACLADEMGLGKTIQSIAYIDAIIKDINKKENIPPFLIICPTSLLMNWEYEVQKFAPDLSFYVHTGKRQERKENLKDRYEKVDIIITSYPLALRDIDALKTCEWSAILLDEAQKLKNVSSKQRKAIKHLRTVHMIALTGTPVENDPLELWSIMDLINPGYLHDEQWFVSRFLTKQGHQKKEVALQELQSLIQPFILRRKKVEFKQELQLPDKIHEKQIVPLSQEQRLLYEAIIEELLEDYSSMSTLKKRAIIFKALTQLKQICNHPAHFLKEHHTTMNNRSGKWDAFFQILEKNKSLKKPTLIFTQYRFMGELLRREMDRRWIGKTPFFHGQLNITQRQDMVNEFQKGEIGPFLLISLRAGGTGINLTRASEVIHYDRWWNPAVENQATDRVHRIGQKEEVTVTTFITEGTLEEKIDKLIEEKMFLQEKLLGNSPLPLWKLSDDEIKSLFSLREVASKD